MKEINLNFNQYLELEKLGENVFSPVKDFMNKNEFNNVVNKMIFKKKVFPLPIVLDIPNKPKEKNFTKINLIYNSLIVGEIYKPEVYRCNKLKTVKKIFGTTSKKHPGVKDFFNKGDWFIGGKTVLKK